MYLVPSFYIRSVLIVTVTFLYAGILIGSLSVTVGPPSLFPHSDKLMHAAAWGLVAAIVVGISRSLWGWLVAAAVIFTSSAGVEWAQSFIPGRSPSWADLVANASGIVVAGSIGWGLRHRIDTKRLGRSRLA